MFTGSKKNAVILKFISERKKWCGICLEQKHKKIYKTHFCIIHSIPDSNYVIIYQPVCLQGGIINELKKEN
jgi:hypothetical protein